VRHLLTVQWRSVFVILIAAMAYAPPVPAQRQPTDPGVRHLATDNRTPHAIAGLGADELNFFQDGMARFSFIEAIPDSAILANARANATSKNQSGVQGHANAILGGNTNLSANDGTITRFGWKAQNKSLLMFAGEAYNVEMGVSNQLFPQERDENPECRTYATTPEDILNMPSTITANGMSVLSDIDAFANFTRMLARPGPNEEYR
jgi:hypothetical protein